MKFEKIVLFLFTKLFETPRINFVRKICEAFIFYTNRNLKTLSIRVFILYCFLYYNTFSDI